MELEAGMVDPATLGISLRENKQDKHKNPDNDDDSALDYSLLRHIHARRWFAAGYPSPSTGGVAPALAVAVVATDNMFEFLGLNVTVKSLANKIFSENILNSFTSKSDTRDVALQSYLTKVVNSLINQLKSYILWTNGLAQEDPELYYAVLDTVFLVIIVATFFIFFRRIPAGQQNI